MNCILRALRLVVAYNVSDNRRTVDVIEKLYSLFCPTWRTGLNNAREIIISPLAGAVFEQEKEETETKSVPEDMKKT